MCGRFFHAAFLLLEAWLGGKPSSGNSESLTVPAANSTGGSRGGSTHLPALWGSGSSSVPAQPLCCAKSAAAVTPPPSCICCMKWNVQSCAWQTFKSWKGKGVKHPGTEACRGPARLWVVLFAPGYPGGRALSWHWEGNAGPGE